MPNLLVVNLHGLINVPMGTRRAIEELCIDKRFSATVVPDDPTTVGTLKLCKDYVAWGPVDRELLTSLLKQRAKVSMRKKLDSAALKSLGYNLKYEELPDWGHAFPYSINERLLMPWFESLPIRAPAE